MDKEVARELAKELIAALEAPEAGPIVPVVRKAARLAALVGDNTTEAILHAHLNGVEGEVGPDETAHSFGWSLVAPATQQAALDRRIPGGTVVPTLDLLTRKCAEIRLSLKAETSSSHARFLHETLNAYEAIEERIRNRVGSFVGRVEASLGPALHAPPAQRQSLGNKIFIGHGGSHVWKDLRFFLKDTLHLDPTEFNTEAQAGNPTVERLTQMLNESCLAFLVATAENEHADGTFHARENVIHETGLFQARLGFKRAIVLLEDGCAKFSNLDGVTDIRFPKGNLIAAAEQIRGVLKREGFLKPDEAAGKTG